MIIKFDSNIDDYLSFYTIYAAFRQFKEFKMEDPSLSLSFTFTEICVLLQQLQDQHPKYYKQAYQEYNKTYGYDFNLN